MGYVLFLGGVIVRSCMLVPGLYGDLLFGRLLDFSKDLQPAYKKMRLAVDSAKVPCIQQALAYEKFKQARMRLRLKHGVSPLRCFLSCSILPFGICSMFYIGAFVEISDACHRVPFFEKQPLNAPDQTYMLPSLAEALFILQANLSLSVSCKKYPNFPLHYARIFRVVSVCAPLLTLPIFAKASSGICLYCMGMGFAGLLQPILLYRKVIFK